MLYSAYKSSNSTFLKLTKKENGDFMNAFLWVDYFNEDIINAQYYD